MTWPTDVAVERARDRVAFAKACALTDPPLISTTCEAPFLTAHHAARLCEAVYSPETTIQAIARLYRLEVAEWFGFGRPGFQAVHLVGPDYQLVLVRGTQPFEDPRDILHDLNQVLVDYQLDGKMITPGAKVAAGFLEHLQPYWRGIAKSVLAWPNRPLYVAGHSLGAAAAALIAGGFAGTVVPLAACFRIAPPAVGNAAFEAYMGRSLDHGFLDVSVENCADLVTRRPETLALFGYRRAKSRWYFDRHEKAHVNPGYFFRWRDRTVARLTSGKPLRIAALHHRVAEYRRIMWPKGERLTGFAQLRTGDLKDRPADVISSDDAIA